MEIENIDNQSNHDDGPNEDYDLPFGSSLDRRAPMARLSMASMLKLKKPLIEDSE